MDLTQGLKKEPFPVPIKRASRAVGNSPTAAVGMHFSDKVLVTISQEGALSQWVRLMFTRFKLFHGSRFSPKQKQQSN